MLRRATGWRVGRRYIVVLFLALTVLQVQASANPGAYHTAVGSGTSLEPGGCTGQFVCRPEHAGDTFSINASDKSGSYGSMTFNSVRISLTCVSIKDVTNGHTLYASGTGSDGAKYYAKVTARTRYGQFLISTASEQNACGGPESYGTPGPGSFVITAM